MKNPDASIFDMILYILTGIGVFDYYAVLFLPLFIIFHRILLRKNLEIVRNAVITIEELIISYATILVYLLIMFYMVVDPLLFFQLDYLGEFLLWLLISLIILLIQRRRVLYYIQKGTSKF